MVNERERPTVADYVITALSPALIMGLVGCLALFMLEVGYAGQYGSKLAWTTCWFVFGAVLVSRIAITVDSSRAWLYGLALGGAVLLAMSKYMDYSVDSPLATVGWLINLTVIVVVLWSANKLTWDCTYIDEKDEDAGCGLMTEVGRKLSASGPMHMDGEPESEGKRKPIGLWVVYFSLATLPLFGLGQALIPADQSGRRVYVFWLMVVYLGCGLSLLMTTSILGVRRYLRQRRQSMSAVMTTVWLGAGVGMILIFLIVGALLPRPLGEYQLVSFTPLGSRDRDASRYAMQSDDAAKGEGQPGGKGKDDTKDAKDGSGGKGQKGGKAGGKSGQPDGSSKDRGEKGGQDDSRDKSKDDGGKSSGGKSRTENDNSQRSSQPSSPSPPSPPSAISGIANVLKWIVVCILAIAIIGFVTWFLLKNLSSAHQWARDLLKALSRFWQSLFGGGQQADTSQEEEVVPGEVVQRPRPFAEFHNPFADGSAAGQSPEELVRYTFAALESWAYDRDLARRDDETPLEFTQRLGEMVPRVEGETRQLAGLYARLAYARRRLPETCRPAIQQLWRRLEGAGSEASVGPASRRSP